MKSKRRSSDGAEDRQYAWQYIIVVVLVRPCYRQCFQCSRGAQTGLHILATSAHMAFTEMAGVSKKYVCLGRRPCVSVSDDKASSLLLCERGNNIRCRKNTATYLRSLSRPHYHSASGSSMYSLPNLISCCRALLMIASPVKTGIPFLKRFTHCPTSSGLAMTWASA